MITAAEKASREEHLYKMPVFVNPEAEIQLAQLIWPKTSFCTKARKSDYSESGVT